MAFTVRALEFIHENHLRNDREWFKQHKQEYQQFVLEPFAELLQTLAPVVRQIDNELVCDPKCVSRIYRDARYIKGGSIFRDSLWCSIRRKKNNVYDLLPEFYFYVSLDGFGYGCGYYRTSTAAMEKLRQMAIEGDKTFKAAKRALDKQKRFCLSGDVYKKNHFPDQKPELWEWLNRRSVCVSYDSADSGELFDVGLFERVAKDMQMIAPVYRLYVKMEELAAAQSEKPHNVK